MGFRETWLGLLHIAPPSLRRGAPLALKKIAVLSLYPAAVRRRPLAAAHYLLHDRETDNFTYDIANAGELARFLSLCLKRNQALVEQYFRELENDVSLGEELNAKLRRRRDRNWSARFGRRLGWYSLVRITKPRLVIESGVHDGLGSSVLLSALQRNTTEGKPGRLIGIDHDSRAAWLIPARLLHLFTLVSEDSLRALESIERTQTMDLFIHDSDHRFAHELAEYQIVDAGLSDRAILLSDNAHTSTALKQFSDQRDRVFDYWSEETKGHFYPGAGIGLSLSRPTK
jgi:predicted O-methyltransferase YrrM